MEYGIKIVAAIEAFNRSSDAGDPIRANMRVQTYIPIRRITPMTARIRFMFFMIKSFPTIKIFLN